MSSQIETDIGAKIDSIRSLFPFFNNRQEGDDWVYLDNAATTQKPQVVIDAIVDFYTRYNANIHRGIYDLSELGTTKYEEARSSIASLIGAREVSEVIFTKGATESLNLVANCWGGVNMKAGDKILLSEMEHHANIVPWQIVAEAQGAEIVPVPITSTGEIDFEFATNELKSGGVKIFAMVQVSNALGIRNPVEELVKIAREHGVFTVVDASQSVSHFSVNVAELECDALVFSGHKMFGPTGIGVLCGKREWLESVPPYQAGGDMIRKVSFSGTSYAGIPSKFEAGTPHISGAIGMGVAADFIKEIGYPVIEAIDDALFQRAVERIEGIPGVRRMGVSKNQIGVVSLDTEGVHPSDIAAFLNVDRIAVRTGHHCAQPLMDKLGVTGTIRASFSIYNTFEDIEKFASSLERIVKRYA